MKEQVILVDIMKAVTDSMNVPNVTPVNFQPGRTTQILKSLIDMDNSINFKAEKYPLVAMELPNILHRGKSILYYAKVKIKRIVFAQITSYDGTETVFDRFSDEGSFKKILYPCYYEFLKQCAWNKNIMCEDQEYFEHDIFENPGSQPIGQGFTDYVDTLEIHNLELTLLQLKTC